MASNIFYCKAKVGLVNETIFVTIPALGNIGQTGKTITYLNKATWNKLFHHKIIEKCRCWCNFCFLRYSNFCFDNCFRPKTFVFYTNDMFHSMFYSDTTVSLLQICRAETKDIFFNSKFYKIFFLKYFNRHILEGFINNLYRYREKVVRLLNQ